MKPIATLMTPLRSVDLADMTAAPAVIERSDVCAISAAAVVGEAVVSLVLADAFLEKFGGDSLAKSTHYATRPPLDEVSERHSLQRRAQERMGARIAKRVIRPILIRHTPLHVARRRSRLTTIPKLIADMVETCMRRLIGLAAPQIGVSLRIFVIDLSLGRKPDDLVVFVNPEFVELEGMQLEEEGCLSIPGFNATVARPMRAVVRGLDRSGTMRTVEGTELLARAFQHEMDHLDGKLFLDRVRGIKRDLIVKKIRKMTRAGKW